MYFNQAEDTIRFIKQFDNDEGSLSVEYGGQTWLHGDYSDINEAMCDICSIYKETIYKTCNKQQMDNDLEMAHMLASKHGYKVVK